MPLFPATSVWTRPAGIAAALLVLLLAGCARPPALPYDLAGLQADIACAGKRTTGCVTLAWRQGPPAPASPPPIRSMKGVLRIVVSLRRQRLYAFRDDRLVASSAVSTGKAGHRTPTGRFRILEKQVEHRSNRYSNAPMPYMERLTSYGVALHAGPLPGYPASHGCIRLPPAFARRLYRMTSLRTTVAVTRARVRSPADALKLI